MSDVRRNLLNKVQAADFALIEANLYLDAYPTSQKALDYFEESKRRSEHLRKEYEAKCGPLTAAGSNNRTKWDWIESPWPWEYGG